MLMLQQQSTEGSSAQRDLAGLCLRGTKAKAKSVCCEGNEEDINSWIMLDEGLATRRNKLTRKESCLAGGSHDSDHHFSEDKHRPEWESISHSGLQRGIVNRVPIPFSWRDSHNNVTAVD